MNHMQQHQAPIEFFNMVAYQYALLNCMDGPELEERGQKYRSWDFAHIVFDSNQTILFNFAERKLNVDYAIQEFLWYCRADRFDKTIENYANAWKKLSQPDGSFFSNYGHYIFAKVNEHDGVSMFQFAAEELVRNPSSRRAAIPLLETKHCYHQNVDMVCTFAIQFFIRDGRLDMGVNMRSNDAIWGLTNDAFCFSMLHRLMYVALRDGFFDDGTASTCGIAMPNLRLGAYHHTANTLHVYERHYGMAQAIMDTKVDSIQLINVPMFSGQDVMTLLHKGTPLWPNHPSSQL